MDLWQAFVKVARGVLRRRKRLAALTLIAALLVFGPVAYVVSRQPARYETSATILLEARPERVPLFQEVSPLLPLPVQLAILNSRNLAEGVLESLPKASFQDLIDSPYYVDYALLVRNLYRRLIGTEPEVISPHERALKELQNARVKFKVPDATGIVMITAEATKPQVAIDLVNTYIEVLLARTRSFNLDDARVSREFLEHQVADLRKTLDASEGSLRIFTAGHGGVKVPEQSKATVDQLAQAESALAEVSTSRKMLEVPVWKWTSSSHTEQMVSPNANRTA